MNKLFLKRIWRVSIHFVQTLLRVTPLRYLIHLLGIPLPLPLSARWAAPGGRLR